MPIPEAYEPVLETLEGKTRAGRVNWAEVNQWSFLSSLDAWSIRIADSGSDEGVEFTLSILDGEGKEVDDFTLGVRDPDFPRLKGIWLMARRSARSIGQALQEIEQSLKSL
jgi:hypothetical protein